MAKGGLGVTARVSSHAGAAGHLERFPLVLNHSVMAGLVPAIHVFLAAAQTWMPGTRPGMTRRRTAPGTGARSSVRGRSPPIKSAAGCAGVLPVRLADGTGKAVGRGRHQDQVHVVRHQAI